MSVCHIRHLLEENLWLIQYIYHSMQLRHFFTAYIHSVLIIVAVIIIIIIDSNCSTRKMAIELKIEEEEKGKAFKLVFRCEY